MKRFRSILFWCHLSVGVFVGLVVLVMSVTGVLLTYQRQITTWADLRGLDGSPPAAQAPRMPLQMVVAGIDGRGTPTAIVVREDPSAPVQVSFGRERVVFVNAYTGRVLGEGSRGVRAFFRVVTDWHRWLGRPEESRWVGKAITGACNLGFLFLVMSGFYLWWPRNWTRQTFRAVLWFRGGLRGKARDFNWHNTIGVWSVVPLFVIVLSGVVISYRWAGNLVYRAAGEAPPPPAEQGGGGSRGQDADPVATLSGVDPLLERADARLPGWRTLTLQVPRQESDTVRLTLDAGTGGQPQARGTLVMARSGEEVRWEPFSAMSPGRKSRQILRFAHTGEVLGLFGQTLAGLVTLGAVFLVWTGLALTLRRFVAWRGRRGGTTPSATPRGRSPRRETAGV